MKGAWARSSPAAWGNKGRTVVTVKRGGAFAEESPTSYRLATGSDEGYRQLLHALAARGIRPRRIVHLWTVTAAGRPLGFSAAQELGFYSLFELARALAKADEAVSEPPPIELAVISNGVFELDGGEELDPAKATILGPVKVIPRELSHIDCRSIDLPKLTATPLPGRAEQLLEELECASPDDLVALRGRRRWVRHFEAVPLEVSKERLSSLSSDGAYLITGRPRWARPVGGSISGRKG